MGLLDDIYKTTSEAATQPKPEKGRFSREGYFDWEKPDFCQEPNVAIGVIFPPYKQWLGERIAAVKSGHPFPTPFMLTHGIHAVGTGQRDKVYTECRKTLVNDNKVGESYPLLPADVLAGGNSCPICDICWDELWPKVKDHEHNKDGHEYKAYKAAHKTACPQQKYLINFLPMRHGKTVIFDLPKSVAEVLGTIHYDRMQPDLLWPYSTDGWQSTWVQIRRQPQSDGTPTKYAVNTLFVGLPQVIDAGKNFMESRYTEILAKVADLREEARKLVPTAESTAKAVEKLVKIVPFKINTSESVRNAVEQATAGGQAGIAQSRPLIQPMTASPTAPAPAPMSAPVAPPMGLPPIMNSPVAPVSPVQLVSNDKAVSFDLLSQLINPSK